MTTTESIAEKLARYARVPLARDLYDLVWYGRTALDEAQVRRLWLQKVYGDVVVDQRWKRPFDASAILTPRSARDIDEESIGFLVHPANVAVWEQQFRARYSFLGDLDIEDQRWAVCDRRDEWEWRTSVAGLPGTPYVTQ